MFGKVKKGKSQCFKFRSNKKLADNFFSWKLLKKGHKGLLMFMVFCSYRPEQVNTY